MSYLGDYCYGTEILELPGEGELGEIKSCPVIDNPEKTDFNLHPRGDNTSLDIRYWFRWVTGHQVMLILWTILVKNLRKKEGELTEEKLTNCIPILEACSVIFEYTGSCSNEFYHQNVRVFMALFHRSFSGLWAADYRPIPHLLRQLTKASCPVHLGHL